MNGPLNENQLETLACIHRVPTRPQASYSEIRKRSRNQTCMQSSKENLYVDSSPCVLQAQFEQLENEMKDSNANYEALMKSFLELTELKHILRKTQAFFEEVNSPCMITVI